MEPLRWRESSRDYFGERGMSWHGGAVFYRKDRMGEQTGNLRGRSRDTSLLGDEFQEQYQMVRPGKRLRRGRGRVISYVERRNCYRRRYILAAKRRKNYFLNIIQRLRIFLKLMLNLVKRFLINLKEETVYIK